MFHQAFLIALSQMSSHRKARILVGEHIILIDEGACGWNFSTQVFSVEGTLPSEIGSCISPSGRIHLQHPGPYLIFDPDRQAIVLKMEAVFEKGKYLPFRDHLKGFVEAAAEWKQTLEMLADKECVPVARYRGRRLNLAVLLGCLLGWMRNGIEILYESFL